MTGETEIDARVAALVDVLSLVPGVQTSASCGGHAHPGAGQVAADRFYVGFYVPLNRRGWRALAVLAWATGEILDGRVTVVAWGEGPDIEDLRFELQGRDSADPDKLAKIIATYVSAKGDHRDS